LISPSGKTTAKTVVNSVFLHMVTTDFSWNPILPVNQTWHHAAPAPRQPDVILLSAAISACEKGEKWRLLVGKSGT